ncbi:MAG: family 16 glycosylhydrolase [Polyangiales bacterium]
MLLVVSAVPVVSLGGCRATTDPGTSAGSESRVSDAPDASSPETTAETNAPSGTPVAGADAAVSGATETGQSAGQGGSAGQAGAAAAPDAGVDAGAAPGVVDAGAAPSVDAGVDAGAVPGVVDAGAAPSEPSAGAPAAGSPAPETAGRSAPADAGADATVDAASPAAPVVSGPPADRVPAGNYQLVFWDEFEGTTLDRSRWCTRLVWTGGPPLDSEAEASDPACTGADGTLGTLDFLKKENQRYVTVNTLGEETHVVSDGTLKLRATKTRDDEYNPYESGIIRSKQGFTPTAAVSYYMTARVKIPNVQGTFAAMWLMEGPGAKALAWPPEIDIFEAALNVKDDTDKMIRLGSHIGGEQTESGSTEYIEWSDGFDVKISTYRAPQSTRDVWMEVSCTWTAEKICYYLDDVNPMCEKYRWVTNSGEKANPAQLLLDLAIGDEWAGRYGIDDSKFPTALEIDYVRVFASQ